mmetsp:Transcript_1407/g.2908  ORF Transcript_1407/g.2908 Transcript_1407/m.2908 type:complete len:236 (+) Transcript_1407:423-1130(+)
MHAPHLGCPQLPQLPQSKSRQHWPQISSPQPTHVRCRRPRWIVKQRTHMPVEVPRLRSIRARSRSRPDCEISLQPSSLRQTREAGSTEMSCEAVTAVQERSRWVRCLNFFKVVSESSFKFHSLMLRCSSCSMFSRECRLSIVSDVQPPKDAVRSSVQSPSPAMAASVSLFASATFTCWSPAAALRTTCKKSLSVKIKVVCRRFMDAFRLLVKSQVDHAFGVCRPASLQARLIRNS